jgi:hypothetical protein
VKKYVPLSDNIPSSSTDPLPGPSHTRTPSPTLTLSPRYDINYTSTPNHSPVLGTGFWSPSQSPVQSPDNIQPLSDPSSPHSLTPDSISSDLLDVSSDISRPQTPEPDQVYNKPYKIVDHKRRYVQKFGLEESIFKIVFSDVWYGNTIYELIDQISAMFEDVMEQVRRMYVPGVRARVYINHPDMQYEAPIFIALRPINLLTADTIMNAVMKVLNSNRGLKVDEGLTIHIGVMDVHRGGGHIRLTRRNEYDKFNEKLKKRSILNILRTPNHPTCAARAIICGAARLRCSIVKYEAVAKKHRGEQYNLAVDLLEQIGLPTDREIAISEFVHIETYLKCQVIVYDMPFKNSCIYGGAYEQEDKIFLYYSQGHFDLITSMSGFLSSHYFCIKCKTPYGNAKKHTCNLYCKTCEYFNCIDDSPMSCHACFRVCHNHDCFNRHIAKKGDGCDTICETYTACKKRNKVMTKADVDDHKCGQYLCFNCKNIVSQGHLCYMRALLPKQTAGKFIFFDFETSTEQRQQCEKGYEKRPIPGCSECADISSECITCSKCINCNDIACHTLLHRANFAVSHTSCRFCQDDIFTPDSTCRHCGARCEECAASYSDSSDYDCTQCYRGCGNRECIFSGPNTAYDFTTYLLSDQNYGIIAMAHSGGSFDFLIVLEQILSEFFINVKAIYSGAKIISLTIPEFSIKLIDSLSFFPMPLKAIPQAFNLKSNKGDFPHFFNVTTNFNYIGPMPDISYYGIDTMSTTAREAFILWYDAQAGKTFDFQVEILNYCRADVTVLREACIKFRRLVLETTSTSTVIENAA